MIKNPLNSAIFANMLAIASLSIGLYTYFISRSDTLRNQRAIAYTDLVRTGVLDETTVQKEFISNPENFNKNILPLFEAVRLLGPPSVTETVQPFIESVQNKFERDKFYSSRNKFRDAVLAANVR